MRRIETSVRKRLEASLEKRLRKLFPKKETGFVGWQDGSTYNESKPNFVRCRWGNGDEFEAWNDGVPPTYNLQVDIYPDPDYPGLLRARQPRIAFVDDFPYVALNFHKSSHTWPGPDAVPIEMRQFMPLHPSASGLVLTVRAGWIKTPTGWLYHHTDTADLTANKPASGARFALVTIDGDGTLTVTDGDVDPGGILTLDPETDIPELPANHTPICAIRLYAGQTEIRDLGTAATDLLDFRFTSFAGAQPASEALSEIAGLEPDDDDIIQQKGGSWVMRTMVELWGDLQAIALAWLLANGYIREKLTANRTYYVRADGSDSNDGLADSAGGAFLTPGRAIQAIQGLDMGGYSVLVQFGAGAFGLTTIESFLSGTGVTFQGTLTALETIASATVAVGGSATRGSVTKAGAFAGDSYADKLAYFVTDDAYRVINSHTDDVLSLEGTAPSSTTQDVIIYDFGTSLAAPLIINQKGITLKHLKLICDSTVSGAGGSNITGGSGVSFVECWLDADPTNPSNLVTAGGLSDFTITRCVGVTRGSSSVQRGIHGINQATLTIQNCKLYHAGSKSGIGIRIREMSACRINMGCTIDNYTTGVASEGKAFIRMLTAGMWNFVQNCTTGLNANEGGGILSTSNNQYSGNDTNEIADATSYSYID